MSIVSKSILTQLSINYFIFFFFFGAFVIVTQNLHRSNGFSANIHPSNYALSAAGSKASDGGNHNKYLVDLNTKKCLTSNKRLRLSQKGKPAM